MAYPPNCQTVDSNNNCVTCLTGYNLFNSTCVFSVPNCISYSPNNTCTKCQTGYLLSSIGTCVKLPDFCLLANSDCICTQCITGYSLTANNLCVATLPNCVLQSDSGTCLQCLNSSYTLETGRCLLKSEAGAFCEGTTGCIMYFNNGTCQRCLSTYQLISGRCAVNIANCKTYNQLFGQCSGCNDGYILFNNQCYIPGSAQYLSAQSVQNTPPITSVVGNASQSGFSVTRVTQTTSSTSTSG